MGRNNLFYVKHTTLVSESFFALSPMSCERELDEFSELDLTRERKSIAGKKDLRRLINGKHVCFHYRATCVRIVEGEAARRMRYEGKLQSIAEGESCTLHQPPV